MNFAELRNAVPIEKMIDTLGPKMTLNGKEHRGPCPACQSTNKRALSITPSLKRFTRFATRPWPNGDLIALYCHIHKLDPRADVKKAADAIADQFGLNASTIPPSSSRQAEPPRAVPVRRDPVKEKAAEGLAKAKERVLFEHEAVQAFGLSPDKAKAYGMGFMSGNGSMATRFVLPVFEDGIHIGYVGYNPELDPPLKFHKNLLDLTNE